MANYTANTLPAPLVLSTLQKILKGQTLPEAPAAVEIRKPLETAEDEINSFLSDIRAAYGVLNDLEESARCFVAYQVAPAALNIERLDLVRDLYRFISESDTRKLIEAAASDMEDITEDGDTLSLYSFDSVQSLISDLVDPYIEPADVKKYFDEDGKNCGFYVLIEYGGPTLFIYSLEDVGTYIHATGRRTGGTSERSLDIEDVEIINDLYFSGELNI